MDERRLLGAASFTTILLAGIVVLLFGAAGYGVALAVGHTRANEAASCPMGDALFLAPGTFGLFSTMVVNREAQLPQRGHAGGAPALYLTEYAGGALHGSIANLALSGPYRDQEDARARSLGYTPGQWPMVPLEGGVVSDNRGLLEVYQSAWNFHSVAAATAWMSARQASVLTDPQAHQANGGLPDVSVVTSVLGSNDGAHEHIVRYLGRHRGTVTEIAFQGGADTTPEATRGYAKQAFDTVAAHCGG